MSQETPAGSETSGINEPDGSSGEVPTDKNDEFQLISGCLRAEAPLPLPHRHSQPARVRNAAAQASEVQAATSQADGQEGTYPNFPYQANYTKGLPKLPNGRADVDPGAYRTMLDILNGARQGQRPDFTLIPLGGRRKQTNPQAGIAFDLEGPDAFAAQPGLFGNPTPSMRPAPRIDGQDTNGRPNHENAAEMVELYWMALMRDVHFADYVTTGAPPNPPAGWPVGNLAQQTADDLNTAPVTSPKFPLNPDRLFQAFREQYPTDPTLPDNLILDTSVDDVRRRRFLVSPATIFRGSAPGDRVGPYISQFLLRGNTSINVSSGQREILRLPEDGMVAHGTQSMNQRQTTVAAYRDYLMDTTSWGEVQSGKNDPSGTDDLQPTPRFIRNLRDLANWVHLDYIYQHFLNAALILLNEPLLGAVGGPSRGQVAPDALDFRPDAVSAQTVVEALPGAKSESAAAHAKRGSKKRALPTGSEESSKQRGPQSTQASPPPPFPPDEGNPYVGGPDAENQIGFVTFGGPHVLTLLAEVNTRAGKASWYQKWYVHRRQRPEEFGGLVHFQKNADAPGPYPCIDPVILNREVLELIRQRNQIPRNQGGGGQDTYLLPQVFPEGSPTHPSYGSGHATVVGACATILKAYFREETPLTDPTNNDPAVAPTDPAKLPVAFVADPNGVRLVAAKGREQVPLTVGGELNKLASNIAIGRNGAGVHWRSDAMQGMALGEAIAAGLLYEQALTFNELHSFTFTTFFTGRKVRIAREMRNTGSRNQFFATLYVVPGSTPDSDINNQNFKPVAEQETP